MSSEPRQVVVGFDFSYGARAALARAIELAGASPHVLRVVCAIEPPQVPGTPLHGRIALAYVDHVEQVLLDVVAAEIDAAGLADRVGYVVEVRVGSAVDEILQAARDVGADLIIVGSRGLARHVPGTTAARVVLEASCTVEVARPKTYAHIDLPPRTAAA